jgi:hypothetical protein
MGKQVFVVTNVAAINTKASRDLLTKGEIGIFAMSAVTSKVERAQTTTNAEFFTIAVGRGGQLFPLATPKIEQGVGTRRQFDWWKAPYTAPVLPQVQVSTTCDGTSAYDDFLLRVSTRFGEDLAGTEFNVKTYGATGTFESFADMYAKIAQAVNADAEADVTATSNSSGVVITPKYVGAILDLGFEYVDNQYKANCQNCLECKSVVTELNEGHDGQGTYAQLMKEIVDARGYMGTIYTDSREVPLPTDMYNSTATDSTWDFYGLKWQNRNQNQGDPGQVFDTFQELLIAVPAGTNFDAVINVVNALTGKTLRIANTV